MSLDAAKKEILEDAYGVFAGLQKSIDKGWTPANSGAARGVSGVLAHAVAAETHAEARAFIESAHLMFYWLDPRVPPGMDYALLKGLIRELAGLMNAVNTSLIDVYQAEIGDLLLRISGSAALAARKAS